MSVYSELQEVFSKSRANYFEARTKCFNFGKALEEELGKALGTSKSVTYFHTFVFQPEGHWDFVISVSLGSPNVKPSLPDERIDIHFGVKPLNGAFEVAFYKFIYTIGTSGIQLSDLVGQVVKTLFDLYSAEGLMYFDERQAGIRHILIEPQNLTLPITE